MPSTNYLVGVRINGDASGLARAAQEGARAQKALGDAGVRESQRAFEFAQRANQARAQLGVRAEREIQGEIARTRQAYAELARSGSLSWQEQRMAARAMREEVTRLTNDMGRMTTRQKVAFGGKAALALGGAVIGAGAVLKPKLDVAMDYDQRLRHVANTQVDATASKDERERARVAANNAVVGAVRYGGGNRDDALAAYGEMVAKGNAFSGTLPRDLLPEIMKAATATDSAATDMSRIAAAGIQNFGMLKGAKDEDRARIAKDWFNVAATGAKIGGFEMKNQAQYLPEQMALAGQVGMTGKTDFANLVMLNQAVEKASGTPDKAAVNVKQLLTDLGSQHFRQRVQQATGVNFTKFAVENRLKGEGMIDSAMDLIDTQVQKHPAYQQLQREQANTTDPERKASIESSMKMIEGSVIARFFHNQESLQAVSAYRANRDFIRSGQKEALSGADVIGLNRDFLQAGPQSQVDRLKAESTNAMQTSMDKLTPIIGSVSTGLAGLMKDYPVYTTAIMAATAALGFLATAAGALAMLGAKLPGGLGGLFGRGAGVPGAPTTPFPTLEAPAAAAGSGAAAAGGGGAAAAGIGLGATVGGVALGGAAATLFAANMVKNNAAAFTGYADDTGFAANIMEAARKGQESREAEAAARSYTATGANSYTYTPPPDSTSVGGYRGAGFDDPRLLTRAPTSLADHLGKGTGDLPLPQEVKGEIVIRVSGAPGLGVKAETKSETSGVRLRADVGTSMTGAGM